MSRIEELIKQYCSDGIPRVKLGTICRVEKERNRLHQSEDAYSITQSGLVKTSDFFKEKTHITSENTSGYYIVKEGWFVYSPSRIDVGSINYLRVKGPVIVSPIDVVFSVDSAKINQSYLLSYLLSYNGMKQILYYREGVEGTGRRSLPFQEFAKIEIPLPPLPVQEEIVRILDSMTELQQNLQDELEARKKQYEAYREKLLTFNELGGGIKRLKISEIGMLTRGNGLQKRDFTESGVGCIHYGQIYTRFGSSTTTTLSYVPEELAAQLTPVRHGNLVIACTSENVEDVCKSVVWMGDEDIVTGGHAAVFSHKENPKYIGYCFQTEDFFNQKRKYAYGAKVIDIKTEKLALIELPIPSREVQDSIVEKLESFEGVIDNIRGELSSRKVQYEFYREKLLNFN